MISLFRYHKVNSAFAVLTDDLRLGVNDKDIITIVDTIKNLFYYAYWHTIPIDISITMAATKPIPVL
jgi:hypothetical protein